MSNDSKLIKRDYRIQVRLTTEMHNRLLNISEKYATPLATLAAVAIAEFVIKKESEYRVIDLLGPQMAHAMQAEFKKLVGEE